MPDMSKMVKMIAAAANKVELYDENNNLVDTLVVVDNCHFGRNMSAVMKALGENFRVKSTTQGFVDESGHFHNRAEAYKIAKASGQPFNDEYTLPGRNGPELDSSCIRHFFEPLG
ncbi:hypothetical protein NVP1081O_306 [Vibrio phage 1.081.O._10N.286.52.C2]|nr:hypothetical protein NVP1081O_306 [Vibrio phage 1.081.O._10N.286.52.C2]